MNSIFTYFLGYIQVRTELNSAEDHVLCFNEIRWILPELHSLLWCVAPLPQHSSAPEQSLQKSPSGGRCLMGFVAEKDEIKKLIILVDLGGTRNKLLYAWTITKKINFWSRFIYMQTNTVSLKVATYITCPNMMAWEICPSIIGCTEKVIMAVFCSLFCFCSTDKMKILSSQWNSYKRAKEKQ